MNGIQFLIAQFGSRAKRGALSSLFLEPAEISGGEWEVFDKMAWRAGTFGRGEINRRRRRTGSFNGTRSYRDKRPDAVGAILIEILQFGNEADALAELPKSRLKLSASPNHPGATVTEATLIEVPNISESSSAFCIEQCASVGDRVNVHRYVVDSVGQVIFITDFVELGEGRSWNDVLDLSRMQAARIRAKLSDSVID